MAHVWDKLRHTETWFRCRDIETQAGRLRDRETRGIDSDIQRLRARFRDIET